MKPVRKISIKIILLTCLLLSCSNNQEIEVEQLARVYVDLQVTADIYSNSDSLEIKRLEVFEKYSISEEVYDSTFIKFSYDKEKWERFFKLANTYLDTLKSDLKKTEKKE